MLVLISEARSSPGMPFDENLADIVFALAHALMPATAQTGRRLTIHTKYDKIFGDNATVRSECEWDFMRSDPVQTPATPQSGRKWIIHANHDKIFGDNTTV
jgi:hypothetical protein